MQCTTVCPGLATHTRAGLCALWLPSAASSSGQLHKPANPQPPQATCPARPQAPVQAPTKLRYTAEAAFDLAVPHGMPRAGYPRTGRALCAVLAECCYHLYEISTQQQNGTPRKQPAHPCRSPQCRTLHNCCTLQRLHLTLQCTTACPGLATHTLAELCALWLPNGAPTTRKVPVGFLWQSLTRQGL